MTDEQKAAVTNEVIDLLRARKVPLGLAIVACANVIATLIAISANDADDALAGTEALMQDMLNDARERAGKVERPN